MTMYCCCVIDTEIIDDYVLLLCYRYPNHWWLCTVVWWVPTRDHDQVLLSLLRAVGRQAASWIISLSRQCSSSTKYRFTVDGKFPVLCFVLLQSSSVIWWYIGLDVYFVFIAFLLLRNRALTSLCNSGLCWTVFARNRDTAVPAGGNCDLQTLICVLVARPRRCLTLSNPVPWQNWMAAYLGYTLRMKMLFCGWPVIVHNTHTRRRRLLC